MKRYWIFRSGILQHYRPITDHRDITRAARDIHATNNKGAKAMQSKEYVLVEEELRYSRAAELKVRGKDVQRYHILELWRPRLSDVVDLVIPQHVMDRKMPKELLEQNEALLKSALARATRGQGWD